MDAERLRIARVFRPLRFDGFVDEDSPAAIPSTMFVSRWACGPTGYFTFGAETLSIAGTPFIFGLDEAHTSQRDRPTKGGKSTLDGISSGRPCRRWTLRRQVRRHASRRLAGRLSPAPDPDAPNLSEEEAHRLPDAIVAMIVACVAPRPRASKMAQASLRMTRLEKVRRAILQDPFAPDLDVCRRGSAFRGRTRRLLEPEGGVAKLHRRGCSRA